jgi:hypothetical protein
MKAFLYEKYYEDSTQEMDILDYKNSQVEIDAACKFNKLTIYNPEDTNRIYTINNIRVKLEYENIMCIKLGTSECYSINTNKNEKSFNKLKLIYDLNDNSLDKGIEIFTAKGLQGENVNILINQYIFFYLRDK